MGWLTLALRILGWFFRKEETSRAAERGKIAEQNLEAATRIAKAQSDDSDGRAERLRQLRENRRKL